MENMELRPVIGLEIHIQLKTGSKMFCSCSNDGENRLPNTTVCPVCLGHPGTLPVANRQALDFGILMGLALGGKIAEETKFDRKHYFYPDLPKGYQISQFDRPIVEGGFLEIDTETGPKKVNLERMHLEEDAAKSSHSSEGYSLVDYNRGGTPLLEIVTKPDIEGPEEARIFLQELRLICRYLGISDGDMEKGQLRCDANISLTPEKNLELGEKKYEAGKLYPKTEIKNLNSFKAVERALLHEIKRQACLWSEGNPPSFQSTRGWDEKKGVTIEQRGKEEAHDYRYFPEPDLPPVSITSEWISAVGKKTVELPRAKRVRFAIEYGFDLEYAKALTETRDLANYAERVISELRRWLPSLDEIEGTEKEAWEKHGKKASKLAANWLINRLVPLLAGKGETVSGSRISAENFAEFITLVYQSKVNSQAAQMLLREMAENGGDPSNIMEDKGLSLVSDEGQLGEIVARVVEGNPKAADDFKKGKENAIMFLLGQVMRQTKGSADPEVVKRLIRERLSA